MYFEKCKTHFICYLNPNKRNSIGVKTNVRTIPQKITNFTFLVFFLISICDKMYFKTCGSYKNISFDVKEVGAF